jgi:hypothetical protein
MSKMLREQLFVTLLRAFFSFWNKVVCEDEDAIRGHIRRLLISLKIRDNSRFDDPATVDEDRAFSLLASTQNWRCAVTANVLSCRPQQLNTMRYPCVLTYFAII